ncbi:MAG: hypothetical protein P1U64_06975 [Alcanivoracaceae bacterium]|nr:hypothetical protein [Alcanivoracaceae bacterium]
MSGVIIRPADRADDAAILTLVRRTPQPGRMVLNFEREPAFFDGAEVTCEQPDVWVAQLPDGDEDVIAVFNIGYRRVFVNGEPRSIRYAHDLRIDPAWRGSLLLVRMFRKLRGILADGEWMQTVILSGNEASMSTVGSGRAGLPTYYPDGHIDTALLFAPLRQSRSDGLLVRRATTADLPLMQEMIDTLGPRRQYFPCYDLAALRDGGRYFRGMHIGDYWLAFEGARLVAMAGLWDQKPFKQTRVLRYPRGTEWLRHGYNVWGRLLGGVTLPPSGGVIDYRSVHTLLVRDDCPLRLQALLRPMVVQARSERAALVLAFFRGDPLAAALEGFRRQLLESEHFLVSYSGDPRPSLEPARLPYIEVARL